MDIDVYQQCPCHGDKKIKFCCGKDILVDLNQVLSKNKSGQSQSALDQLDRAMEKMGPKDCLLTIKTHILITAGEIELAKEANELFLSSNPQHSTGLHHRALILLAEGKMVDSVEALQDAMDSIKGNEIPISLANAFRMVGLGLYAQGRLIAARAHLIYALALKGDRDPELQQILHEIQSAPSTPLILKQDFALGVAPADVEWESKFVNVGRAMDRGQFRKALKFLGKIDEAFPDQPLVVRAIAIVNGYLGRVPELVSGMRRFAGLDATEQLRAVEAEAIAQLFDDKPLTAPVTVERVTFELTETEKVTELALSSSRMSSSGKIESDPFQEGPPPRHAFVVLDRDRVSSAEGLTHENVPTVISELLVYGKQTDRPARFECITARDGRYEELKKLIDENFGEFVDGEPKSAPMGQSNAMSELLEWRWHLPEGVTRKQHAEMVKAHREVVILEQWTQLPFSVLGDQSPEAASKDPAYEVPLRALVLTLENASQGQFFNDKLGEKLQKKLGLSDYQTIEAAPDERISSPIEQQYLDYKKLSDEQLMQIQADAMAIGNVRVLKQVVTEALERPDFKGSTRDMCYSMMAHFGDDDEQSLKYIEQACEEATKAGRPIGLYLVQEFEFRLSRGMTEGLPDLLTRIQQGHLDDPDVEYQLVRVLDRFGIGPDRGPLRGAPGQQAPPPPPQPAAAAQPAASGGAIWTPDQGAAPAPEIKDSSDEASGESKSGLYIPD